MQQRLQERVRAARAGDGGFTLIELLIVIVILGVLAGIVVFSVNFITDRGTKTACRTDQRNVQAAIEAYEADKSTYPTVITDLKPNYIRTLPQEGVANPPYTITYDAGNHVAVANNGNGC